MGSMFSKRKVFTSAGRKISDSVLGCFDEQDVAMAKPGTDKEKIKNFLQAQPGNENRLFKIAVGFVSRSRGGHAAIILQDFEANNEATLFMPDIQIVPDKTISAEHNLRLLHLRFDHDADEPKPLVLALDVRGEDVLCYRYFEVLRIQTTERVLRHVALKSSPEDYSLIASDCATFARNFTIGILEHLKHLGIIDDAQFKKCKKHLVAYIHIKDGWIGESEDESRKELLMSQDFSG